MACVRSGGRSPKRVTKCRRSAAPVDGNVFQQQRRGRGRHRENAVGAADLPRPHMDRGGQHLFRGQTLHQQADRRHVRHGVHGPHLVEMNPLHRRSVYAALSICNQTVNRQNVPPDLLAHRQCGNQCPDIVHAGVAVGMPAVTVTVFVIVGMVMIVGMLMIVLMIVVMLMVMLVIVVMLMLMDVIVFIRFHAFIFIHSAHPDGEMRPRDAAFLHGGAEVRHLRQPQPVQFLHKAPGVRQKLQQRRGQHIAGRAHAAVQIKCFHP